MIKTYIENDAQANKVTELRFKTGCYRNSRIHMRDYPFATYERDEVVDGRAKRHWLDWYENKGDVVSCEEFIRRIERYLAKKAPRKVTMAEVCKKFGEEVVIEKETV